MNIFNIIWMLTVNLAQSKKSNIILQKNLHLANPTIISFPDVRKKMWILWAKKEMKL
jgi:hypothetical protein